LKLKFAVFIASSLIALNAFAAGVEIWPRVLTNRTPVSIHWEGTPVWLAEAAIKVDGSRVIVEVEDWGCVLAAPCLSSGSFDLPALPGGNYELIMKTTDGEVLTTRNFAVYDVTTVPMFPNGGPLRPGSAKFTAFADRAPLALTFGTQSGQSAEGNVVVPDAATAGGVDVQYANTERGISGIARNAFIYTDGDACRDERIWEKVLIPTDYSGTGAFGSVWRTEVAVHGVAARVIGPGQPCPFSNESFGTGGTRPGGYYLRVARSSAHLLQYRVRVSDASPNAASIPVELPVLRENEWLRVPASIELPPPSPNRRVMLRLYAADDAITSVNINHGARRVTLQEMGPDAPRFAVTDISTFGGTLFLSPEPASMHNRYWAVVTVTDNVTQQVYVYAAPKGQ
jgi:hypothetical protein